MPDAEALHEQIDMAPVYEKYPILKIVDEPMDHRFHRRRSILNFVPRWGVGAEVGVFAGAFSEFLLQITKPKKFFAIDPWWVAFGERFPNWGEYSANGTLETRAGYEAALHRTKRFPQAEVVVAKALDWAATLEPETLDWVYLDSTHQYEPTYAELTALAPKLKRDGILLGDDCWANRKARHYTVFRAVRDFCRESGFEIIQLDMAGQWAARRTID